MKVAFWRAIGRDDRWAEYPSLAGLSLEAHAHHQCGDEVEFEFCASAEALAGSDADVAAISSVTDAWPWALEAIAACKAAGKYVVVGGRHVTHCPESVPPAVDVAVVGEGEYAFANIVWSQLLGTRGPGLSDGPKLSLRENTWLPLAAPSPNGWAAVVSRGCPFRCTFCSATGAQRRFAPQYIGEWFGKRRQKLDRVGLYDLSFLGDAEWVAATVAELKQAGAGDSWEVTMVGGQTPLITDEACKQLASIGVGVIGVGLESASPRILRKLKPGVTLEDHERALRLCYKHGLTLHGSWIFGTPGETDEDLQRTYDFIERWQGRGFRTAGLYVLTPYPGTHWWTWARQRGIIREPVDWSRWRLAASGEADWEHCIYLNEKAMPRQRARYWRDRVKQLSRQRDPDGIPEGAL